MRIADLGLRGFDLAHPALSLSKGRIERTAAALAQARAAAPHGAGGEGLRISDCGDSTLLTPP